MPRKPRFVVPGLAHHVTQRGNNRQPVFFTDADRECWLRGLFEHAESLRIRLLAYCLMTNHVHLIVVPPEPDSLCRLMRRIQCDYARLVNFRRGACGHLWHSRFYSCPMSELDALAAIAYVERNPVRAGMIRNAWDYQWSSAAVHVGGIDERGHIDLSLWSNYYTPERWIDVLRLGIREEAWQARFREATRRGLPLGPDAYVKALAERYGRDLSMRPVGRPQIMVNGGVVVASSA